MFPRIVAFVLAVAVQRQPLHAQATRSDATARDTVDGFIAAEMARNHIPGVSLAVVRGGTVIKVEGYGLADLEHAIPVTPETVFKIGSVSKQFLAAGIMLLAQDGRLSVDESVANHFGGAPESWRDITLRHFLTHTSGVLREGPAFDPLKVQPDSVVVRSAFTRPLEFQTGSKYQYCNVCYFTLADIIARVSGKPWDVFLAERVFRPTGMTATRTTTTTELVPRRARGYTWRDNRYLNAPEYLALRPSGAFLSTVLDLAKWDAALYGDRILSRASREAMWTPVRLTGGGSYGYGFGWTLDSVDGHWRVHHGGSLPGFRAELARFPNDSLTVIVLANADGARPEEIARGVARIYLSTVARPVTRESLIKSSLRTVEIPSGRVETVYGEDRHFEAPNWSPDGRFFVVNSRGRLYRLPRSGDQRLQEIPTGFATRLNNDHGISPDGRHLALSHHADEHITDPAQDWLASSIFILPIGGGPTPVKVTAQAPSFWHGWSPDGQTLAFVGRRDGEWDIYAIPVSGGAERRLTTCRGLDDGPDYTPDGAFIYYNSFCSGKMEIWRMRSDGSEPQQLTRDAYSNWFPHPSPDGRWVVFLAYLEDQGEAHPFGKQVKLRLMDRQDGSVRDLTPPFFGGQGTLNVPSWSPDSRRVAFVAYEVR